jgi:glycosyltransferase involved in cell wall biosynthesis
MQIISIIIPVYNVSKYLEKCIRSCYNQNVPLVNYEIILVNDGSTDDSLEICKNLKKEFLDLKIINQENKGLSGARNTGLKHAEGTYIWFIDSDDWIENTALETIFKALTLFEADLFWVGHDVVINKQSVRRYIPEPIKKPISGEDFLSNHLGQLFYVWKFIYKRSFLVENNLNFEEGILFEDLEFTPRVLIKTKSCYTISKSIYNYLIRPGSIANISNIKNKTISDRLYVIGNIINLEQSANTSITASKALQNIVLENYLSTIKMSARGNLKLSLLAHQTLEKIKLTNYEIQNNILEYILMNLSLKAYHYFYKVAFNLASKFRHHE